MDSIVPYTTLLQQKLNKPQFEAATYTGGPLLILAGAGSGKTRVITHRMAYLIQEKNCAPWNILAVTFTNKAAGEMRERVTELLNASTKGFWIGTFHSICARILRIHGKALGIESNFSIYDRGDSLTAFKRATSHTNIEAKKAKSYLNAISKAKNKFEFPEDLLLKAVEDFDQKAAKGYQLYQDKLRENNALDFDDLLIQTVRLLKENPEILKSFQTRFRYIMVDEYQDTNQPQYLLLRDLAEAHQEICVVGDDDQSIYRWRGADVRNILEFGHNFPNAKIVRLEENYRSTQTIIDAAYHVVKQNSSRHPKKIFTKNEPGEKITVMPASDEAMEADWISDEINRIREENIQPYANFAVFYRVNAQSRLLEEAFVKKGMPYKLVGTTAFYQRKEIKDVIAYLKLLANPADAVSFERIINEPKRKLGAKSVEKLMQFAEARQVSILHAAYVIPSDGIESGLSTAAKTGFGQFARQYAKWKEDTIEGTLAGLVRKIVEESGYWDMLESSVDEQDKARVENIEEFYNACYQFESTYESEDDQEVVTPHLLLGKFLEQSALVSDQDTLVDEDEGVVMMTIHSSKGLEFPYVFMTGMEEELFPHSNALYADRPEPEIEEERRLCYVGMTRAKSKLYMTYAYARRLYNRSGYTMPSRFIKEIPDEYKEETGGAPSRRESSIMDFSAYTGSQTPKKDEVFVAGDMVNHRSFGLGVIVDVQGEGKSAYITIDFQEFGKKTLVQEYARLMKV